jgi:hypothetical protein
MELLQTGASVLAALLVGLLARGVRSTWRTHLLLALSVLAVSWFQPILHSTFISGYPQSPGAGCSNLVHHIRASRGENV